MQRVIANVSEQHYMRYQRHPLLNVIFFYK